MPLRTLTSTFGILCALLAFGCQPDCRLMCEEIEEADCAGGSTPDCESQCKHDQDLVTNAGCEADYDALLACYDDLENICDAFELCSTADTSCDEPECDNEVEDLADCYVDYCEDHPRNNECESLFGPKI